MSISHRSALPCLPVGNCDFLGDIRCWKVLSYRWVTNIGRRADAYLLPAAAAARAIPCWYVATFWAEEMIWWLRPWMDTSCPAAAARRAPTVARSRGTWAQGSEWYQRMA